MSRSQPKPKIIFKTLDDLIKSSSLSKKNMTRAHQELNSCTVPVRSTTEVSTHSLRKSSSKHSIRSKEKPPQSDLILKSFIRQSKQCSNITYEGVHQEIGKVYEEMETYLHHSKTKVINELKNESDNCKIEAKVKELEKMSDYLKHIIDVFTSQASEVLINQRQILNDKQNYNTDKLSRIHKKKSTSRYLHNESRKNPSVYEKILSRMH